MTSDSAFLSPVVPVVPEIPSHPPHLSYLSYPYNRLVQPPASLKALGDPIYEAFYGLNDQPFAITTDPKFFYLSASHQRAFSELLNGLRRREGLMMLTGETGSGKTTLCRAVLDALGDRTFSAMVLNPYMSGTEVYRTVLRDFGVVSPEEMRRGAVAGADVPQLLSILEGFLRSLTPFAGHAVIVLDEAQSLDPKVLDQIRMLTALEKDNRRLVQVLLCGQPNLLETLKAEPMHALNERITRRIALSPLTPDDVASYIQHRIAVAGGADAVRFEPQAVLVVADLSHGLPRRVNVLCDRALQEGRIEGASVITADMVKRAARSVAGAHDPTPATRPSPQPTDGADSEIVSPEFASLSLGQVEAPKRTGLKMAMIGGGALLLAALAYGYYAQKTAAAGRTPSPVSTPSTPKPEAPAPSAPAEPSNSTVPGGAMAPSATEPGSSASTPATSSPSSKPVSPAVPAPATGAPASPGRSSTAPAAPKSPGLAPPAAGAPQGSGQIPDNSNKLN